MIFKFYMENYLKFKLFSKNSKGYMMTSLLGPLIVKYCPQRPSYSNTFEHRCGVFSERQFSRKGVLTYKFFYSYLYTHVKFHI